MYRTRAINNRGFYYFFTQSHVGFSLMFGGIPLILCGLYSGDVNIQERVILTRLQYFILNSYYLLSLACMYQASYSHCHPLLLDIACNQHHIWQGNGKDIHIHHFQLVLIINDPIKTVLHYFLVHIAVITSFVWPAKFRLHTTIRISSSITLHFFSSITFCRARDRTFISIISNRT